MKFGLTQTFHCSYLPDQQEQLLVSTDVPSQFNYEILINQGFRRSNDQIYRPHCPACQACEALRIPVNEFVPSKSHKRVLQRNRDISVCQQPRSQSDYYPLYERYINTRHADGDMYPATEAQYRDFLTQGWDRPLFMECFHQEKLVAVAVIDELSQAYSALYTFFDPDYQARSFGTFTILKQIELAQQQGKVYLYLGYQIDACRKMNYKANFYPHQRFRQQRWQQITKKSS